MEFKSKLIELRDEGATYAMLETRQGRTVWIDLDTPNPMSMTATIEDTSNFWGMTDLETESGWYFDFDDIVKIIESKED